MQLLLDWKLIKTTFENLDIFYSNEVQFYLELKITDLKVIKLSKSFNKPKTYFAEAYLPLMYKYLSKFLAEQILLENPYSMPSKKLMLEYAKYLASEKE
jgi:hypothetical protein